MMSLGTIDGILDKLQTILIQENYPSENLTTITIDWDEDAVIVECNSEKSTILIEKDLFYDSKKYFLEELIFSIKKFSLLNIHASIKICDSKLPNDSHLYETKSCDTFYSKVSEYTGLKKNIIFELLLPLYKSQIYFFVRPENLDESIARLLITSGSYNSAAVNSLYAEMTNASEQLENLSFIGRIKSCDHQILKKIVDCVVRNLLILLRKQEYVEKNSIESLQKGVIDLTTGLIEEEGPQEPDDEIFYDFNTSDIMETDLPLDHFYDPKIRGLTEGWDARIDDERYKQVSYDEELMSQFLNCLLNEDNYEPEWDEGLESNEVLSPIKKLQRSKSDDDLQIVSVGSTSDNFGKNSGTWKLKQRNNDKVQHPTSSKMSLGGYRIPKKNIKSNLFNNEEVVKWEKSKGPNDMSKLLSGNSDYKNLQQYLDKDYRIPKKSYNGPSPRPSIHNKTKDSQINKQDPKSNMMRLFQKNVERIAPYESPSGHRLTERSTPESVSNFFNVETIHVIDDDEDDNNNSHRTNDKVLQKGPAKRKLLPISPKIFKNRRTDYNYNDSPFSSNFNKNSSGRRNL